MNAMMRGTIKPKPLALFRTNNNNSHRIIRGEHGMGAVLHGTTPPSSNMHDFEFLH
jgi:hypothetical protein